MINAHTSSRIEVAAKLCNAKDTILSVRSYVCVSQKEVVKIDNIVSEIDEIVNRVMGVGK